MEKLTTRKRLNEAVRKAESNLFPKPNINDVSLAFQQFKNSMMFSNMPPIQNVEAWQKQADANTKTLKIKLKVLGLAQYIDWSKKE